MNDNSRNPWLGPTSQVILSILWCRAHVTENQKVISGAFHYWRGISVCATGRLDVTENHKVISGAFHYWR